MIDLQHKLLQQLIDGADNLSVSIDETRLEKLLTYLNEFDKWNKAYNLSAVRNIEHMVARHILDSLSVVPYFAQPAYAHFENIIDVGTGGGLPGIPLAIMFPEKRFTLLDSNGKKTRFLFHVKNLLNLNNVTVENHRVEQFHPAKKFQAVISRAFASLQDMTEGCDHLLTADGVFMAMKGLYPTDELLPLHGKIHLEASYPLNVPGTEGERHLLILKPVR